MQLKFKPMGDYQTNCYIITINGKDLIIDPGVNATKWIQENVKNPIVILNTHGHFDHVWSNKEISNLYKIKIYTPQEDNFMLQKDFYGLGMPPSNADYLVKPDEEINFEEIKVKFHHFPGHTPGCSAIQIDSVLFSGDFIFKGSIGRTDLPFSDSKKMYNSLNKVLAWKKNIKIYPGHGKPTTLDDERKSLENWKYYL